MLETTLVVSSFLTSYLGFTLVALSQERHWSAVQGNDTLPPGRPPAWGFAAGIGCLLASLCAAVASQGPAFGSLLWVMEISATAVAVSLTLSWWPRALRLLLFLPRRHPLRTGDGGSDAASVSRATAPENS
jgi:tellurite resistance protein TehA-like permease